MGESVMEAIWNYAKRAQRRPLLERAGYAPNAYLARVWMAIPSWVREDVAYAHRMAKA